MPTAAPADQPAAAAAAAVAPAAAAAGGEAVAGDEAAEPAGVAAQAAWPPSVWTRDEAMVKPASSAASAQIPERHLSFGGAADSGKSNEQRRGR